MDDYKVNTNEGENAVTQICNLFNISRPAFKRPYLYDSDSFEGIEDDGLGMGGIGGGAVYGSDDLVYDPNTNTYVEYGEILEKYYQAMIDKTFGEGYTKEEKEALEKYFAILYGGFENEEKE